MFFASFVLVLCGLSLPNMSIYVRPGLALPRLAVHLLLQCREDDFFALFGTVCSSWVSINLGTSRRSVALPEGNTRLLYIRQANSMVSRMTGQGSLCPSLFDACSHHAAYMLRGRLYCKHARTCLLYFVIVCLGGSFMLEQPGSSLMNHYHRFQYLCSKLRVTLLLYITLFPFQCA